MSMRASCGDLIVGFSMSANGPLLVTTQVAALTCHTAPDLLSPSLSDKRSEGCPRLPGDMSLAGSEIHYLINLARCDQLGEHSTSQPLSWLGVCM